MFSVFVLPYPTSNHSFTIKVQPLVTVLKPIDLMKPRGS